MKLTNRIEIVSELCDKIHEAFPAHPQEGPYGFAV
jgi:hypothetical protein